MGGVHQATLPPIFTVGHSTRTIEAFVTLLGAGRVDVIVDIRSVPRSRANPQYNLDVLPDELASHRIGYERIAELGGLRAASRLVAPHVNGFWQNRSFHNYADYALSESFEVGLGRLLQLSGVRRCAIMCAEALWWRCHRRIVADYLLSRGLVVEHLMGDSRLEPARMTEAARPQGNKLIYPGDPAEFESRAGAARTWGTDESRRHQRNVIRAGRSKGEENVEETRHPRGSPAGAVSARSGS